MPAWLKVIGGVIGTVLVGAIGSGVWDVVIKPYSGTLTYGLVYVSTFGLRFLQNALYIEVAKGTYDRNSLTLLAVLTSGSLGVTLGMVASPMSLARPDRLAQTEQAISAKIAELKLRITKLQRRISFLLLLVSIFCFLNYIQNAYVTHAAVYVEQLINVISPDVDANELSLFRSQAASIRSRDDYVKLINDMQNIALAHNRNPPLFSIL